MIEDEIGSISYVMVKEVNLLLFCAFPLNGVIRLANFCILGGFRLHQCEYSESDHQPCGQSRLYPSSSPQTAHSPALCRLLLERHYVSGSKGIAILGI